MVVIIPITIKQLQFGKQMARRCLLVRWKIRLCIINHSNQTVIGIFLARPWGRPGSPRHSEQYFHGTFSVAVRTNRRKKTTAFKHTMQLKYMYSRHASPSGMNKCVTMRCVHMCPNICAPRSPGISVCECVYTLFIYDEKCTNCARTDAHARRVTCECVDGQTLAGAAPRAISHMCIHRGNAAPRICLSINVSM